MATHDVELIEYFFAHTVTPALVAVLVPAAVLVTLARLRLAVALGARAVPSYTALSPCSAARASIA